MAKKWNPLNDASIPGTVPTKKYRGRRKYHKGCSGKQTIHPDIEPFVAKGKNKTKTMKEIYAEVPQSKPDVRAKRKARKTRQMLAEMKMPVPEKRKANPKKHRSDRRPRRVVWPSEKNPLPRYNRDGTKKE